MYGIIGVVLTFSILISLTGIGALPGGFIGFGVLAAISKDDKFIGVGPFILSTLVADGIIAILIIGFITSLNI